MEYEGKYRQWRKGSIRSDQTCDFPQISIIKTSRSQVNSTKAKHIKRNRHPIKPDKTAEHHHKKKDL